MDSKMKVENLDLYYGKFKALKNINLDLPKMRSQHLSDHLDVVNLHF